MGNALAFNGQPEEGISNLEKGLKLNPQDPHTSFFLQMLARAHLTARHYEKAVEHARASINRRSDWPFAYVVLASALGHLGRTEEASGAMEKCEELEPGRIMKAVEELPRTHRNRGDAEHILEGLRKAGWQG